MIYFKKYPKLLNGSAD